MAHIAQYGAFSDRAIRLALLDGMKAEDQRTEARLSARLRDEADALFQVQRQINALSKEMLVVQRRIAALADAIAIEETRRVA